MLFIFFTLSIFVTTICHQLYVFQQNNPAGDFIQLQEMKDGYCDSITPISKYEYDDFFSEPFMALDEKNKIVYTIGLQKNLTLPSGPFIPFLIGLNADDGKKESMTRLDCLDQSFLGEESYSLEVDSNTGMIYIVGVVGGRIRTHELLQIDPSNNFRITNFGNVFDDSGQITASTYVEDTQTLYIAYTGDIFIIQLSSTGITNITSIDNKKNLGILEYHKSTNRIYGIGKDQDPPNGNNGYLDQTLYYLDLETHEYTKVHYIESGDSDLVYGVSSLDQENGILYAFVGPYIPHAPEYYLFGIRIKDGSEESKCYADPVEGCCTAVLSAPWLK